MILIDGHICMLLGFDRIEILMIQASVQQKFASADILHDCIFKEFLTFLSITSCQFMDAKKAWPITSLASLGPPPNLSIKKNIFIQELIWDTHTHTQLIYRDFKNINQ